MNPITVTHSDTEITYNESENKWTFTLRGRDRSAESLVKAKELIDKPVPAEKAKPFEKIPVWFFKYNGPPVKAEVIGIAEGRGYGRSEYVWINCEGTRKKESTAYSIYPSDKKNDALVEQIIAKEKEIENARKAVDSLKQKLSPLVLPKDEVPA